MTPVETLRAAAADMRAKAEAATPGPWEAHADNLGEFFVDRISEDDDDSGDEVAATFLNVGNAAHIASWHPAVALAVAGVLHYAADGIDRTWQDTPEVSLPEPYLTALAVARAYLGES